ncbi:MAG TPA: APC family permease [Gemmatimonadales bacterium]|nr:APC family permease [Gemmatimonadales bacterium]
MPQLPRVMRLRDVVLFNVTAIVGLRWLTTAAQFGPASLVLWLLAMMAFFLPSAAAVRELADVDPGAGGIYRWVHRAFGPRHAMVAGWLYWSNNLLYFPSLLLTTAAMAAYVGGRGTVALQDNAWFVGAVSLAALWLAVSMNVVGLRVGRWLHNVGGHGTWGAATLFVLLAAWALVTRGSATTFETAHVLPAKFDFQLVNFFATMTFAFAGLELAPSLGDEIHNAAATLRRGAALSGVAIAAMYVVGTTAVLVALPAQQVSITTGVPQAAAALVDRLGGTHAALFAGAIALLLVVGNVGGVGAWLAGSARLPFAAGVDRALPVAFARVHPEWQTPHVALLLQGVLATAFVIAGLVGATVRDAYVALTSTTIVAYFIPYLYLFGAYLRLRRRRTLNTLVTGWLGCSAVALSIGLSFVPPAVERPVLFEAKVIGGTIVFVGIGLLLAARSGGGGPRDRR